MTAAWCSRMPRTGEKFNRKNILGKGGRIVPRVIVGDQVIYYEIAGSGFPLVLIRGLGSSAAHWYDQLPVFAGHFSVVAFDHRGIGRSPQTTGFRLLYREHGSRYHRVDGCTWYLPGTCSGSEHGGDDRSRTCDQLSRTNFGAGARFHPLRRTPICPARSMGTRAHAAVDCHWKVPGLRDGLDVSFHLRDPARPSGYHCKVS